ncbi:hypothetical protein [Priestia megaterium]|uniref:hypothetical protein n=1 Tax=Priestia megaterium TaxID=1404 RepID=UPI0037C93C36
MGNCKKQDRKRSELDINELFKRFKLESKQIQKTLKDIEGSLKRSQELMQRLLTTRTRNNVLPNENAFFNVAEAPAVPTPVPQAQVTITQQTLINNIFSTVREISRVRSQIRNTLEALIIGVLLIGRGGLLRLGFERAQEIALGVLVLMSQLENLTLQLEELQDNLDINIALLANTVL